MRLRIFCILIALFFYAQINAQLEASIWYFGGYAGLDFRSGVPVPLTDGALYTAEGCATISDASGNLLFYTDGSTVWNRNHLQMPNGSGLLGDKSSSQSAIIVPKPNDPDIYYIFTADFQASADGINYSEVDMTLEGGLGDITVKNVQLITPATEKLTAVKHANGRDIWVITHGWRNTDFLAYLVTPAGVNMVPVVSSVGLDLAMGLTNASAAGYIKASPNGTKLAVGHKLVGAEILDFDDATGIISNPILLVDGNAPYGVEFSPSNQILYLCMEGGRMYQYDLNAADIRASALEINNSSYGEYALQLAIDGKIYITNELTNTLSVINNPNTLGLGCNYEFATVNLGSGRSIYGLPPFIQSFFLISDIQVDNFCFGNTTEFGISASEPVISVLWDFGDGNTSTDEHTTHVYTATGDYTVSVTITTAMETRTDTKDITIYENPVAHTPSDLEICDPDNDGSAIFDLSQIDVEVLGTQNAAIMEISYHGSQVDADANTNPLVTNFDSTNYQETIYVRLANASNPNCYDTTSFQLLIFDTPVIPTVSDWYACDDDNDGILSFDLPLKTSEILSSFPSGTVSFHETQNDADLDQNAIVGNYSNTANPQTIYFRIESPGNADCYNLGQFQIQVFDTPTATMPLDIVVCDVDETGNYTFDLGQKDLEILNGQDHGEYEVLYFDSEQNARNNNNPVSKTAYGNATVRDEVFARVHNPLFPDCFATSSFSILINPLPQLNLQDTYVICPDSPDLTIEAGSFETYDWQDSSGNTLGTAPEQFIDQLGHYSLTVTETQNGAMCSNTHNFEVVSSGAPDSFTVETKGISDQVNLIVDAVGIGTFEYSLDGLNFQTSNQFTVFPGQYTVYVRDPFECRTLSQEIIALGYQKFFSPNGDGYHENWNVIGAEQFPDSKLFIYDRQGKLLRQISPFGVGWDGTYLSRQMPSSDYWFRFEYGEGEVLTGHFTLKR